FYRFVCDLGFTTVNACYPMSEDCEDKKGADHRAGKTLYGAASTSPLVSFSNEEKALIFKALYDTIPQFRGAIRIFSPRCTLHGLIKKFTAAQPALFPCRGGSDFFFADCKNGVISPCGYRDEPRDELPNLKQRAGLTTYCDLCEWECFRDPSDVLGPFAMLFSQPVHLLHKMVKDPRFFQILMNDLSYYRACGYFNGRLAPQWQALKRFQR
ncbi:MAG: radical SAM protein, partial [Desulfofustis sp.]|nr:radical SAM protein [Desulfofustis sp.]